MFSMAGRSHARDAVRARGVHESARCAISAILTIATVTALLSAVAAGRLRNLRQAELGALLAQHSLAGELDAVALDGEHLDEDLIALAEFVLDFLDAMLGDLGDVQQAVGAGEDLDEGAELSETHDLAEVGLADLGHGGEIADHLDGLGETLGVRGGDVHAAGVVDIDLDAGGVDDAADDLAARTDEIANLVGRDLDGVDARSVLGLLLAGRADDGVHGVEQEQAAAAWPGREPRA